MTKKKSNSSAKPIKKRRTVKRDRASRPQGARVDRPYPRATLEDGIKLPYMIKDKNGGNPWSPDQVASALGMGRMSNPFFYLAAASRDFGFTEGGRDSQTISLTDFGRDLVYAPNKVVEERIKRTAFGSIGIFSRVLEYYNGSKLPEMKYLSNTLERQFNLHPDTHKEFSKLFRDNCEF